jgi:hypothetical protein
MFKQLTYRLKCLTSKRDRVLSIYFEQTRSFNLAMMQACDETIIQQIKQVSLPKYLTARIRDIWMLHHPNVSNSSRQIFWQ